MSLLGEASTCATAPQLNHGLVYWMVLMVPFLQNSLFEPVLPHQYSINRFDFSPIQEQVRIPMVNRKVLRDLAMTVYK
jgi:hypothetical protein